MFSSRFKYYIVTLCACFSILASGAAGATYCVKIGPIESETHALAVITSATAMGWSGFSRETGEDGERLTFGNYQFYPEADYAGKIARGNVDNSARAGVRAGDAGAVIDTAASISKPVFRGLPANIALMPEHVIPETDQVTTGIYQMIQEGDKPSARASLDSLIEMAENTDPRKGWAYTQKGILLLGAGNYKASLEALRMAAEARVATPKVDQVKAMRRVAWVYHQVGERAHAYQAYDELERFSASDYMKAVARVEKCGILMEYARSEKGTLADCRKTYETALKEISPEHKRQRGTIELMNMETYFYEGNYAEAIRLAESWLLTYDDQLRDKYMVLQALAMSYDKTGEVEKSKQTAARTMELPVPTDPWDQFGADGKTWDMKARILTGLQASAKARGDKATEQHWKEQSTEYARTVAAVK